MLQRGNRSTTAVTLNITCPTDAGMKSTPIEVAYGIQQVLQIGKPVLQQNLTLLQLEIELKLFI